MYASSARQSGYFTSRARTNSDCFQTPGEDSNRNMKLNMH